MKGLLSVETEVNTDVIIESICDGVFTVDASWEITSFNRAAEEITGINRSEAIGRRCSSIFRASMCETDCALRHTMSSGEPIINKPAFIIGPHGQRVPVTVSTALLKDAAGNVIGGAETFRDVSEVEGLHQELLARYRLGDILSQSPAMHAIFDILPTIAESNSTVLIQGDTGTGKELVARALHEHSRRCEEPFVAINCGALPDNLLESELFGYKAGAFTGATKDKPGRIAAAEGGTLFLDEIADISPALQVRLLRFLQERTYELLGSNDSVSANVRVIAAANRSLAEVVDSGEFRRDLYYRVKVVLLELPPLCDRLEDIPLLVDHFVSRFNALQGKKVEGVSQEAMAVLMAHDWPGNVRELENAVEHAFVLCHEGECGIMHLPTEFHPDRSRPLDRGSGSALKDAVATSISTALERNAYSRVATARELGIHPSTLFRKMKSLGITFPDQDGRNRC